MKVQTINNSYNNNLNSRTARVNHSQECNNVRKEINFKAFKGADRFAVSELPASVFNYMQQMVPKITKNIDLQIIQSPAFERQYGAKPCCLIKTLKDTLIRVNGKNEIKRINTWLPVYDTASGVKYPFIKEATNKGIGAKYEFINFDRFDNKAPNELCGKDDKFVRSLYFLQKLNEYLEKNGGDRFAKFINAVK